MTLTGEDHIKHVACVLYALDDLHDRYRTWKWGGRKKCVEWIETSGVGVSVEDMHELADWAHVRVLDSGNIDYTQGDDRVTFTYDKTYTTDPNDYVVIAYTDGQGWGHATCTFAKNIRDYKRWQIARVIVPNCILLEKR